ncbi:MAG TPA: tetratricopeptide repeat protein [Rhizomicrobium sp.]|jgi:tetratricopeptide (TPR) repeat protein
MRQLFAAAALLLLACSAAQAEDTPWTADTALLNNTEAAVQSGGILAVASRVPQLEQALANAKPAYSNGVTTYILADGPAETLIASAMKPAPGITETVVVQTPYPLISLYLASYYDETNRFADAVRVLDLGLSQGAVPGMALGEMRAPLLIERGEALNSLKRWDDALADFDQALKLSDVPDDLRAHMYRGRGISLTELGRLDDAEASYRQSLQIEPGNAVALHELDYIARLRAGGQATTPGLAPLQPAAPGH